MCLWRDGKSGVSPYFISGSNENGLLAGPMRNRRSCNTSTSFILKVNLMAVSTALERAFTALPLCTTLYNQELIIALVYLQA